MMDLVAWGQETLTWAFFFGIINIIIIDLILAGDNAVVIAMAVRSLPRRQRRWGIILGAGAAVLLRVVLTFFVAQLLGIQFVKLVGGVLIAWIAVKLFIEGAPEQTDKEAKSLLQAMWLIIVADITMSTDNVLAVAGASRGDPFLLFFGLALSIPFVVFTSNLLSMLMDRYPVIIYIGAAILGRVGAEMIFTDPFVEGWVHLPAWGKYALEAAFAAGVIVIGKAWIWYAFRRAEKMAAVPAGPPEREADSRAGVSGKTALSALARRHSRWLPVVEIRSRRTPWMPAEGRRIRIFAGSAGYVLLEEKEEARRSGS